MAPWPPQNTPLYARYIDDVFAGFDDAKASSSFLNILNSIGVARGGPMGPNEGPRAPEPLTDNQEALGPQVKNGGPGACNWQTGGP